MTVKRIALFLLAMTLALCGAAAAESETFRNGKVLEVTGGAVVMRSSYAMPVYAQMMIQSGDQVETAADGWVVLCVDDDKYLILEPETKASFALEGNTRQGMIRIDLLQGAIYTEIENPLSGGDGYEITTADGVMAVRGTNFRASHETDEEHQQRQTDIQLFFGEVEVSANGEPLRTETLTGGEEISLTTPLDENGEPEFSDKRPLNLDNLPEEYDRDKLKEPDALFGQEGTPVCGACGQEIINEEDHAPVESLSKYCKEQHYRCTGTQHRCDPNHDHNPDKVGVQEGCGREHSCQSSSAYTLCRMCGDMWCDDDNGGHETACGNANHRPCQVGLYRREDHQICPHGCGGYLCDGNGHGTGSGQCSYVPPATCTYCAAEGVQHDAAPCGQHCTAQSGEHSLCSYGCGGYLCDGNGHGAGSGQCSYVEIKCNYCAAVGVQHDAEPCGLHCTEQSGDHTQCFACGTYYCNGWLHHENCDHCYSPADAGIHAFCVFCEEGYLCWDGHGDGLCNVQP